LPSGSHGLKGEYMRAILLTAYGDPLHGLTCVSVREPRRPQASEVLIEVEFAPINVSDLLLARGVYAVRPKLPSVVGNEGVGTVIALGEGVRNVAVGDRVLIPLGTFSWAERVVAPAVGLVIVPAGIDVRQAAMLSINPPTASLLLSEHVNLTAGDWIVQNAANSGVGRAVIAFAKHRGLKTINIVRNPELIRQLRSVGADVVVMRSENLVGEVKEAVGGHEVKLGLDAIGGGAADTILDLLTPGGTLVAYAAMAEEPMQIDTLKLVGKRISVRGFFMYYPEFAQKLPAAIREGVGLAKSGNIYVPISAEYPLEEIKDALKHVTRGGKVMLRLAPK
jgi:NADPH:quinone reductase-like Zn-dependent oxidoreductase